VIALSNLNESCLILHENKTKMLFRRVQQVLSPTDKDICKFESSQKDESRKSAVG